MNIYSTAEGIAHALQSCLGGIEQTAGEIGQHEQSADAEEAAWLDGVAIAVQPLLKELVLACASQCDKRAATHDRHIAVRNEAMKCAASIRHHLICREGESICLRCDGDGCDSCNGEGIRAARVLQGENDDE